jgi:tRNA threonylcarbamoyladenosine biosynthesis protein TsaB
LEGKLLRQKARSSAWKHRIGVRKCARICAMLILAVDTSTRMGSLSVLRGRTVLGQMANCSDELYSTRLFSDLDTLLGQARVSLPQFELFAVAAGPGSFTGLRVGLAAVKAWAEIFGKPIAAVSGLEAIAAQAPGLLGMPPSTVLAPVLDARRGQVFGGLYRRRDDGTDGLESLSDEVVMGADEFLQFTAERSIAGTAVFVSPTPEVIRPFLERSALGAARVEEVSGVLAPVIGLLGYGRALRGELVDALRLDANYVRRTDAELNLRGR